MKLPFEKYIVLPDVHIFYEDYLTNLAVQKYMEDVAGSEHPFSGWIQLGDFLDFNCISKYSLGYKEEEGEGIFEYYEAGNKFLDIHQRIVRENKNAEMVLLEGNHDYRMEDWLMHYGNDKHRRAYDYQRNLKLNERDIKWVRNWATGELFQKGNAYFSHGRYTNQYHAKKMVTNFGACIYYGHTHDVMEIPIVQAGPDKTLVGKSLGCLADYNQKYLRGNPTNWQQAFAVFSFFPDGFYTEHTVRIFDHRFEINDKVYDGNKLAGKLKPMPHPIRNVHQTV